MGSTIRGAALGLVWVLGAALRAYEQEPVQQTTPRFVVGVEVVALDASVVDRAGRPVDGLTPDDFEVKVDGTRRRIVSAQFINHLKSGVDAAITAVLGAAPGRDPAPPPARRNVMIVFDEDSLETENGLVARRAALTLLDGLSPLDRVGVNLIPRVRGNFTLTSDRAATRRTLNAWVPGAFRDMPFPYWIGLTEAIEITRQDKMTLDKVVLRECPGSPPDPYCPRDIVDYARQIAERSAEKGTQTLEALRDLGAGLRKIAGPKVLVLVSGGLPKPESNFDFDAVATEFAAAEITLYTLFLEKPVSSRIRYRQSPTQGDDDRLEEFQLGSATSAVGGTFLQVIGQVEPQFQRIARELSASYLLGIEVESVDRDGRPHKVSIKVNRSGLDVRGRQQYVIPAPK